MICSPLKPLNAKRRADLVQVRCFTSQQFDLLQIVHSEKLSNADDNVALLVDGNWGKWSLWSACSKTCKQGKQSRQRLCNYPAPRYGGKKCEGPSSQEKICNENVSCPGK